MSGSCEGRRRVGTVTDSFCDLTRVHANRMHLFDRGDLTRCTPMTTRKPRYRDAERVERILWEIVVALELPANRFTIPCTACGGTTVCKSPQLPFAWCWARVQTAKGMACPMRMSCSSTSGLASATGRPEYSPATIVPAASARAASKSCALSRRAASERVAMRSWWLMMRAHSVPRPTIYGGERSPENIKGGRQC